MDREPRIDERDALYEGTGSSTQTTRPLTDDAYEKARDAADAAEHRVESFSSSVAEKLQGAASKLHEEADRLPGGEKIQDFARSAGDKMGAAAHYFRDREVKDMVTDVDHFVRRHPGPSLLCAAAVGFLVGWAFRHEES
jgi:ElaB/YqjD/DUF883 family membrane-anchored ribosome-binding protein